MQAAQLGFFLGATASWDSLAERVSEKERDRVRAQAPTSNVAAHLPEADDDGNRNIALVPGMGYYLVVS